MNRWELVNSWQVRFRPSSSELIWYLCWIGFLWIVEEDWDMGLLRPDLYYCFDLEEDLFEWFYSLILEAEDYPMTFYLELLLFSAELLRLLIMRFLLYRSYCWLIIYSSSFNIWYRFSIYCFLWFTSSKFTGSWFLLTEPNNF